MGSLAIKLTGRSIIRSKHCESIGFNKGWEVKPLLEGPSCERFGTLGASHGGGEYSHGVTLKFFKC